MDADGEAGVFRALADSTRRQILEELRAGELPAGEIAARFPISAPSVSRHLGVLKTAGLVRERRAANRIIYSLAEDRLALCVSRFLSAVCPEQFVFRQHARGNLRAGTPQTGAGHGPDSGVEPGGTTPSGELPG
jgi:DNA-binding transcriptional ArsR family regulator